MKKHVSILVSFLLILMMAGSVWAGDNAADLDIEQLSRNSEQAAAEPMAELPDTEEPEVSAQEEDIAETDDIEAEAQDAAADDAGEAAEESEEAGDSETDIIDEILAALHNDTYSNTLSALKEGEIVKNGTVSDTAAGLQQTLVDLGCGIDVDGSAGPKTFTALNSVLETIGQATAEQVDAEVYSRLLPPLLIAADEEKADEILWNYYENTENSNQYLYVKGCVFYVQGRYYHAKEMFEESHYQDYEERATACEQPVPANGELWHNDSMYSQAMYLTFTVNSSNESESMYFEVYTEDGTLASTLFLTGSGSVTTSLPGGNYRIKDATGTNWYGMKDTFGRYGSYEFMEFYEFEDDEYLTALDSGYEWTITVNITEGSASGTDVGAYSTDWDTWSEN